MKQEIYICWVYSTALSPIGCFETWRRFHSVEKAKKWMASREKMKKHMFFRYILVDNKEVDHL